MQPFENSHDLHKSLAVYGHNTTAVRQGGEGNGTQKAKR